nr:2',5'-phosphodiesterase 12-like [Onthophagus taurus]
MNKPTACKVAHLRYSEKSNQCDLRFTLEVKDEKYGTLCEEIKSVRQITDTVASLLRHTKNKIIKLLQDKEWDIEKYEDFNISLTRKSIPIQDEVCCKDIFQYKHMYFNIMNNRFLVIVNAPLIISLTLPKVIYIHTVVRPIIKAMFLHKKRSTIMWQKSKDKKKWTFVSSNFLYTARKEDSDYYFKVTYTPSNEDGVLGDVVEVISDDVVCTIPPLSVEYISARHQFTKEKLSNNEFRVVSYNILADQYTRDGQFEYVDCKYLSSQYRWRLSMNELLGYNADIICLQEIEYSSFHEFYKGHLTSCGFTPAFYKKGRILNEGLGFMFDRSRFQRIEVKHIVLAQQLKENGNCSDIYSVIKRNKDLKEGVLKQHTSLLLAALQCKNTKTVLVVANTHLFYHSEAGDIRLVQAVIANKCIQKFCNDVKSICNGSKIAVIFCGDFNSLPESGVYNYMINDISKCNKELEQIGCNTNFLKKNLIYGSAYETPPFTNYTDNFKGCLDYIFYEKDAMELTKIVPLPTEDEMSVNVALPNQYFPSDHVALIADFKLL